MTKPYLVAKSRLRRQHPDAAIWRMLRQPPIDSALEMLNPGAARSADRRTRTTAISLGEQRLAVVQKALAAGDRAQKANAQFDPPFDPPSGAQAEDEPERPDGGVIEIEIVYPRRGRDILPYIPFI